MRNVRGAAALLMLLAGSAAAAPPAEDACLASLTAARAELAGLEQIARADETSVRYKAGARAIMGFAPATVEHANHAGSHQLFYTFDKAGPELAVRLAARYDASGCDDPAQCFFDGGTSDPSHIMTGLGSDEQGRAVLSCFYLDQAEVTANALNALGR